MSSSQSKSKVRTATLLYEGPMYDFDQMSDMVRVKIISILDELKKTAVEKGKDENYVQSVLDKYQARVTMRTTGSSVGSIDYVYYTLDNPVMKCRSKIDLLKRLGLYEAPPVSKELALTSGIVAPLARPPPGSKPTSLANNRPRKAHIKSIAVTLLNDDYELINPIRVSKYTVVTKIGKVESTSIKNGKLYPIGYTARSLFPSPIAPTKDVVYECTVLPGPRFVVKHVGGPTPLDIVSKPSDKTATPARSTASLSKPSSVTRPSATSSAAPSAASTTNNGTSTKPTEVIVVEDDSPIKKKPSLTPIKPSASSAFRPPAALSLTSNNAPQSAKTPASTAAQNGTATTGNSAPASASGATTTTGAAAAGSSSPSKSAAKSIGNNNSNGNSIKKKPPSALGSNKKNDDKASVRSDDSNSGKNNNKKKKEEHHQQQQPVKQKKAPFEVAAERNRIEPESISDRMLQFSAEGGTPHEAWMNLVSEFEARVVDAMNRFNYMASIQPGTHIEETVFVVVRQLVDDVEWKVSHIHRPTIMVNEEIKTLLGDFMFGLMDHRVLQCIKALPGADEALRSVPRNVRKPPVEVSSERICKDMEKKLAKAVLNLSEKFRQQETRAERANERRMRLELNASRTIQDKAKKQVTKQVQQIRKIEQQPQDTSRRILALQGLSKLEMDIKSKMAGRTKLLEDFGETVRLVKEFWDQGRPIESSILTDELSLLTSVIPQEIERSWRTMDSRLVEGWNFCSTFAATLGICSPEALAPYVAGEVVCEDKLCIKTRAPTFRPAMELDEFIAAFEAADERLLAPIFTGLLRLAAATVHGVREDNRLRSETAKKNGHVFIEPGDETDLFGKIVRVDRAVRDGDCIHFLVNDVPICEATWFELVRVCFGFRYLGRTPMMQPAAQVATGEESSLESMNERLSQLNQELEQATSEARIEEVTKLILEEEKRIRRMVAEMDAAEQEAERLKQQQVQQEVAQVNGSQAMDVESSSSSAVAPSVQSGAAPQADSAVTIESSTASAPAAVAPSTPTKDNSSPKQATEQEQLVDERTNLTMDEENKRAEGSGEGGSMVDNDDEEEDEDDAKNKRSPSKRRPAWAQVLLELKETPSNRARKMKDLIERALKLVPKHEKNPRKILRDALDLYQSNAGAKMRDKALEATRIEEALNASHTVAKALGDEDEEDEEDDEEEAEYSDDDDDESFSVSVRPMTPLDSHCLRSAVQKILGRSPNAQVETSLRLIEYKLSSGGFPSAAACLREIDSCLGYGPTAGSRSSTRFQKEHVLKDLRALNADFKQALEQACKESGMVSGESDKDVIYVEKKKETPSPLDFELSHRESAMKEDGSLPPDADGYVDGEEPSPMIESLLKARQFSDLSKEHRVEMLSGMVEWAMQADEIRQDMKAREAEVEKARSKFGNANQLYSIAGTVSTGTCDAETAVVSFLTEHQGTLEPLGISLQSIEAIKRDVHEELIAKKKNQRSLPLKIELDRLLAGYEVRSKMLGIDRNGRGYVHVPAFPNGLFVLLPDRQSQNRCFQVTSHFKELGSAFESSPDSREQLLGTAIKDMLPVLTDEGGPEARPLIWTKIPEMDEALVALKKKQQAQQPPPKKKSGGEIWLDNGPHVGARVGRQFPFADVPNSRLYRVGGFIAGYLPAEGEDPALWKMIHDDGDAEDLENYEVEESLRLALSPVATQSGFFFPFFPDTVACQRTTLKFAKSAAEKCFSIAEFESKQLLDVKVSLLCMDRALNTKWEKRSNFQFIVLHSRTWKGVRNALAMFEQFCVDSQLINPSFHVSYPAMTSAWDVDSISALACRVLTLDRHLKYPSPQEIALALREKREKEEAEERRLAEEKKRAQQLERKRKAEEEKQRKAEEAKRLKQAHEARRGELGLRERRKMVEEESESGSEEEEEEEEESEEEQTTTSRGGRRSTSSSKRGSKAPPKKKSKVVEEEEDDDEEEEEQEEESEEEESPRSRRRPQRSTRAKSFKPQESEEEEVGSEASNDEEEEDEEDEEEEEESEESEEAIVRKRPSRAAKPTSFAGRQSSSSRKSVSSRDSAKDALKGLSLADQRAIRAARRG